MTTSGERPGVAQRVLTAFGWTGTAEPLGSGLINETYRVVVDGQVVAVLQRLHPVFGPEVNLDLEAVTQHLAARGLQTPVLIRPTSGAAWVEDGGRIWRAISYLEGETRDRIDGEQAAESAAELVARFHVALSDFDYAYRSVRAGVHDTAAHLTKLSRLAARPADGSERDAGLAAQILQAAAEVPAKPTDLPRRNAHGDLKISNVLFEPGTTRARCLIDLDTCGQLELAYELGDMLRSWCNASGEDTAGPSFDASIYAAALRGYGRGAGGLLSEGEGRSIVWGLRTICVELAARFCADVFEDAYFGWDQQRFASRREHNRVRAAGQLALARQVALRAHELQAVARATLQL